MWRGVVGPKSWALEVFAARVGCSCSCSWVLRQARGVVGGRAGWPLATADFMSRDYTPVSTNDEDEDDTRTAASPASVNGKPLLKPGQEKQSFAQLVKEDFWSNFNFLCCGGYKRELKELRAQREAFSQVRRWGGKPRNTRESAILPERTPTDS